MQIINAKKLEKGDNIRLDAERTAQKTLNSEPKETIPAEETQNLRETEDSSEEREDSSCVDAEPISNGFDGLKSLVGKIDVAAIAVSENGESNEGEDN